MKNLTELQDFGTLCGLYVLESPRDEMKRVDDGEHIRTQHTLFIHSFHDKGMEINLL